MCYKILCYNILIHLVIKEHKMKQKLKVNSNLSHKNIALISCSKVKNDHKVEAQNMYLGDLFKLSLALAKEMQMDKIYILSSEYGLLNIDTKIEPDTVCLKKFKKGEKQDWPNKVIHQLGQETELENEQFYIFAGIKYREHLLDSLTHVHIPMQNLKVGKQLKLLKEQLKYYDTVNKSLELHKIFNQAKRYDNSFNADELINNGIYILFEKGETYKGMDRVVRIGTHTGENKLPARMVQHYQIETKDRSIFRKNIGRIYLNLENDPYIDVWNVSNTERANRLRNLPYRDFEKEASLEARITEEINNHFSFVLIKVEDKIYRLYLEMAIIATIAQGDSKPSASWLGNNSPVDKIRDYGLWQVQGLKREPITNEDLEYIKQHIVNP